MKRALRFQVPPHQRPCLSILTSKCRNVVADQQVLSTTQAHPNVQLDFIRCASCTFSFSALRHNFSSTRSPLTHDSANSRAAVHGNEGQHVGSEELLDGTDHYMRGGNGDRTLEDNNTNSSPRRRHLDDEPPFNGNNISGDDDVGAFSGFPTTTTTTTTTTTETIVLEDDLLDSIPSPEELGGGASVHPDNNSGEKKKKMSIAEKLNAEMLASMKADLALNAEKTPPKTTAAAPPRDEVPPEVKQQVLQVQQSAKTTPRSFSNAPVVPTPVVNLKRPASTEGPAAPSNVSTTTTTASNAAAASTGDLELQVVEEIDMLVSTPIPIGHVYRQLTPDARKFLNSKKIPLELFLMKHKNRFAIFKNFRSSVMNVSRADCVPEVAQRAVNVVKSEDMFNGTEIDPDIQGIYTVLKYIPNEWSPFTSLGIPETVREGIMRGRAKHYFERHPKYFEVKPQSLKACTFEVRRSLSLQQHVANQSRKTPK